MHLWCATGNPGKLREFYLAADRADLQLELLPNFQSLPPAVEDGGTFEENALRKALHYARFVEGRLFADDSGLEVEALHNAPGVYSARYSGPEATDEANNRLLLENLRGVANRTARFVCAIALVEGEKVIGTWRGAVKGRILEAPRGTGGFGYDPLFYYEPFAGTFGEATAEQKLHASHRGQAFRAMLDALG